MEIFEVGVVGGGTMGADIAILIARDAGVLVTVKEMNEELAQKAKERMDKRIDSWVQKGKILQDQADIKKNLIRATANTADLAEVDLIIEAVPENMELKKKIFAELDTVVKKSAILASNTSALSITEIAKATQRPDKMVGMHFFNPPTKMPLIEIIKGEATSVETVRAIEEFSTSSLQKFSILVKECPGFLVNRLLTAYLNEAAFSLENHLFSLQTLDEKAREFGWPMGPFTLIDMLGMDVANEVSKVLHLGYGERMKPSQILQKLMELGRLGQKNGAGFYVYNEEKGFEDFEKILERESGQRTAIEAETVFHRMMIQMVNEAVRALEEDVSTAEDIEKSCLFGVGFPMDKEGPLHWADSIGLNKILEELQKLEEVFGTRYQPAELLKQYATEGKTFFESW